ESGRIGALFVRGPRDIRTPADRVASLLAYIHNNPVRAGVVSTAADSDWTSHRAYLGLERRPPWLQVDLALARAGFSTPEAFDEWTRLAPSDPTRDDRGRARLGEGDDELRSEASVHQTPTVGANVVVDAVAELTNLSVASIRSRRKGRIHARARRAAV